MSVRGRLRASAVVAGCCVVVTVGATHAAAAPLTDLLGTIGSGSAGPGTGASEGNRIATLINGPSTDYTVSGMDVPGGGLTCLSTPRLGAGSLVSRNSRVVFFVTRLTLPRCDRKDAAITVHLVSPSGATIAVSYTVAAGSYYTGACSETTGGATCEFERVTINATEATLT